MRLINPVYVPAANPLAAVKTSIDNYFAANPTVQYVTFDQMRTFFSKTAAQWPDGAIQEQLKAWGYTVLLD